MKVSIGISFYNAEQFLPFAINSVLNQTFRDFELILLDDGSTDNSLKIAQSYSDSRIRIVSDGENHGLAYRLNQLVNISEGKYFARMDADDIMHPERIQRQLAYLTEHPQIDVLGCDVFTIDTNNQIKGTIQYNHNPKSITDVYQHSCFIHPTVIARREWFLQNPYDINATRMEDYNLWLRTVESYHFVNMRDNLLYYRTTGLPYLSRYLKSMKGERMELSKLKHKIPGYYKIVAKNYMKCLAYCIFSLLHITDMLINLRSSQIKDVSKLHFGYKGLEIGIAPPRTTIKRCLSSLSKEKFSSTYN